MRVRPVHVSFLKEARNALTYRHCSFHIINRPQTGRGLKYFMRLVAIGFGYGDSPERKQLAAMNARGLIISSCAR